MAVIWPEVLKAFSGEDCFRYWEGLSARSELIDIANLLLCPVVEQSVPTNTVYKGAFRLRPLCAYRRFFFNVLKKWFFQTLPQLGTSTFVESLT